MKKEITIINYNHFDNGVSSFRTKFFKLYLEKNGYKVQIIAKKENQPFLKWIFYVLKSIEYNNVLVSIPHNLSILIVILLAGKKRIILDERDPWSHNIKNIWNYKNNIIKYIKYNFAVLLEKLAYKRVHRYVVCTYGMHNYYRDLFSDESKLLLIENGSDLIFNEEEKINQNNKYTAIIAGKFFEYSESKGKKLLSFLNRLAKNIDIDIELKIIGNGKDVEKYCLLNCKNLKINYLGVIPYEKVAIHLFNSDIGLFVERCEETGNTTKIFDYLISNLILISYVNELQSNTVKRFEEEGVFYIGDTSNHEVTEKLIIDTLQHKSIKKVNKKYSREFFAKKLLEILN